MYKGVILKKIYERMLADDKSATELLGAGMREFGLGVVRVGGGVDFAQILHIDFT